MRTALDAFTAYLQTHFLARWILANVVGWSLGLYLGSVCVSALGSVVGVILGSALAGVIVGAAQWRTLRGQARWRGRQWVAASAMGSALGVFPAALTGIVLLARWGVGVLIVGGVYGGMFGLAQVAVLREYVPESGWWVAANIAGAALCGLCSLGINPLALPIFCTPGPLLFGAITGWVMARLLRTAPNSLQL